MSENQQEKPKTPEQIIRDQIWDLNWDIGRAAVEVETLQRQLQEALNERTRAIQSLVSFHRDHGVSVNCTYFQIPSPNHDYLLDFQDADAGEFTLTPLHSNLSLAALILEKQEAAK